MPTRPRVGILIHILISRSGVIFLTAKITPVGGFACRRTQRILETATPVGGQVVARGTHPLSPSLEKRGGIKHVCVGCEKRLKMRAQA